MPDAGYNEIDIAWAAGLFEGEGWFTVKTKGGIGWRKRFEMGVTMTDKDVVEKFAGIASCGNLKPKRMRKEKPHWKDQYEWVAGGVSGKAFAQLLLPHLCERRKARFAEIMQIVEESLPKTRPCERCGVVFEPTRFARERFCSQRCRYRDKYLRQRYGVGTQEALLAKEDRCPATEAGDPCMLEPGHVGHHRWAPFG